MGWLNRSLIVSPYHYSLCITEASYLEALKDLGITPEKSGPWIANPQSNATCHRLEKFKTGQAAKMSAIICMQPIEDKVVAYGLLIHEAVHLWQGIKEYMGEQNPSKEFEAYSIQVLSQNLMWDYDKQYKKLFKKSKSK